MVEPALGDVLRASVALCLLLIPSWCQLLSRLLVLTIRVPLRTLTSKVPCLSTAETRPGSHRGGVGLSEALAILLRALDALWLLIVPRALLHLLLVLGSRLELVAVQQIGLTLEALLVVEGLTRETLQVALLRVELGAEVASRLLTLDPPLLVVDLLTFVLNPQGTINDITKSRKGDTCHM